MNQKVFDNARNGFYRDTVKDFDIVFKDKEVSMGSSHYHPYFEICCVKKGQCRIFVDHNLFFVNEGEIVILPPSTLHRNQYEKEMPAERVNLSFTQEFVEPFLRPLMPNFLEKTLFLGKMSFSGKERREFFYVLDLLLKEKERNDFYSELNIHGLILTLFAMIGRNGNNIKNEELIDQTTAAVQESAKFIFENYAQKITLDEAAGVAGMCSTYFSRKFMEVTGYGFKEYLTNVRIKRSQEMLTTGKLTVTQIAFACGFTDANYFGDAFRKCTGCSPREFRKKYNFAEK